MDFIAFQMLKCSEKTGFPGFKKFGKYHVLYPLLEINSIHNTQYLKFYTKEIFYNLTMESICPFNSYKHFLESKFHRPTLGKCQTEQSALAGNYNRFIQASSHTYPYHVLRPRSESQGTLRVRVLYPMKG